MAQKNGAGQLREIFSAQARQQVEDEYGNTVGSWVEQSRHRVSLVARRGGEAVIAGRLQGTVNYIVTARYCVAAAAITPDHRFVDERTGVAYAIHTAVPRPKRDYIDFDVEIGVAE